MDFLIGIVGDGFVFQVTSTQVKKGFILHTGHLREGGVMSLGATVSVQVNEDRRQGIRRAHSATPDCDSSSKPAGLSSSGCPPLRK